jgi:hypothetical protein
MGENNLMAIATYLNETNVLAETNVLGTNVLDKTNVLVTNVLAENNVMATMNENKARHCD